MEKISLHYFSQLQTHLYGKLFLVFLQRMALSNFTINSKDYLILQTNQNRSWFVLKVFTFTSWILHVVFSLEDYVISYFLWSFISNLIRKLVLNASKIVFKVIVTFIYFQNCNKRKSNHRYLEKFTFQEIID